MRSNSEVVVLMGVSGAGKTAVGERLAERLSWSFVDADDLHPDSNVRKMTAGVPLTDADRLPWLQRVRDVIVEHAEAGRSAVVACSALKRDYRRILLMEPSRAQEPVNGPTGRSEDGTPMAGAGIRLVYLRAAPAVLERRLRERRDHFFDPSLLTSQLETLEEPTETEPAQALIVDADGELEAVVEAVAVALGLPESPGPEIEGRPRREDP